MILETNLPCTIRENKPSGIRLSAGSRARPLKLLSVGDQARCDWILFNVCANSLELGGGSDQMIVAFVLPERSPLGTHHLVSPMTGPVAEDDSETRRQYVGTRRGVHS